MTPVAEAVLVGVAGLGHSHRNTPSKPNKHVPGNFSIKTLCALSIGAGGVTTPCSSLIAGLKKTSSLDLCKSLTMQLRKSAP